jgi:anti-anti-sigma factor
MHGNVDMTVEDGRATAALSGDFDMAATFTVEPRFERLLAEPELDALRIDLSRLEFIDSTGIGVLMRVTDEVRRRDLDFEIVPGPREVHRVFEVAGLADALPFAEPEPPEGGS